MRSVLYRLLSTTHLRKMVYSHRGTGGEEGWMDPPRVFNMLQYFETILPSVETL